MRVLITGSAGMLGSSVYPAFVAAGHHVVATDLAPRPVGSLSMEALDVRDAAQVRRWMKDFEPELVLHLAAETNLEICEAEPDQAYRTNTVGTQHVALACRDRDVTLAYISTAGVFDGLKDTGPYTEFDVANPINVYGDSKYQGELFVLRLVPRHFVVRAGWMVGGGDRDHKFVARILDQLRNGRTVLYAVADKLGTPTYTSDFASNLLELLDTPLYGRYHMACLGEGTRYDVAREVVAALGRSDVEVVPVASSHFAEEFSAPRPRSEMMRNLMLDLHELNRMRPWQIALRAYIETLGLMPPADEPALRDASVSR